MKKNKKHFIYIYIYNLPTIKKHSVMRQEFSHISAPGSQVYRVRVKRAVFHVTFPCIPSHMQPTCCSVSSTPAPRTCTPWTLVTLPSADTHWAALAVRARRRSSPSQPETQTPADTWILTGTFSVSVYSEVSHSISCVSVLLFLPLC